MMPSQPNPTSYNFPEMLAAYAILNRMGFEPADLYFRIMLDPGRRPCVGVELRPMEARGQGADWAGKYVRISGEAVAGSESETWIRLRSDMIRWNQTSQEDRETHMRGSRMWLKRVEIGALTAIRGFRVTHDLDVDIQPTQAPASA